jgi:hypothetical protein
LRCDGTKRNVGGEGVLDKRFSNIYPEIGIRKIAVCKNKDIWQKLGLYLSRYRERWE